jgi:hypothetical protein
MAADAQIIQLIRVRRPVQQLLPDGSLILVDAAVKGEPPLHRSMHCCKATCPIHDHLS